MRPGHWPQVGVGVIVVRDGKVLVGKRQGSHAPGTWVMPGGKQNAGETVEECAARELLEETGLSAESVTKVPVYTDYVFADEGRHYVAVYVQATVPAGDPAVIEPDKMGEWRWVPWDAIPKPHFPAYQQLFEQGFRPLGA